MTENNLAIWERLGKTDPSQTKGFSRAGGFKGTAVKPIYTEQKMTETFGPCGIGWGFSEPQFQIVPGAEGETLVYCWVTLWIEQGGKRSEPIPGVGGDKIVSKNKYGFQSDDEAFKKAFTDAVGNAMKHLGMSADVHMGLFDDSKYVNERRAEEAQAEQPQPAEPKTLVKDQRVLWAEMRDELDACMTLDDLGTLWRSAAFQAEFKKLKPDWADQLTDHKEARKADLSGKPVPRVAANFDNMETAQ